MSELALEKIWENQRTRNPVLNLARTGLTELPKELFECVWLEELILSNRILNQQERKWENQADTGPYNLLRELPEEFNKLTKLKKLYAGGSGHISVFGKTVFYDYWAVKDISVLKRLTNLQSLDLSVTKISDISILKGLTNLQSLDLSYTSVEKISVLKELTKLQSLGLRSPTVKDISVLKGLNKLQSLDLRSTAVKDISVLKGFKNLQLLDLGSTTVKNISVLRRLSQLQSLDLSGNKRIQYISVLKGLNNLKSLHFSNTSVENISVLKGLNNLKSLDLRSTAVKDISVLKGLNNLQSLDLSYTSVENISVLKGLDKLQSLDLSYTNVENISILKGLTNLQSLDLRSPAVKDISVLQELNNLQSLDLRSIAVKDISALQRLHNLQSLYLSGNRKIENISVLHGLKKLQSLDLRSTAVKDISALEGLNNLQSLDLRNIDVKDISTLQGLNNLQSLYLSNTSVENISVLKGLNNLQSLDLSRNRQIQDISVLQGLNNLQSLDFSRNRQIQEISALQGLNNLQSLDLKGTTVKDISSLQGLINLQSLYLRSTVVKDISVLKGLTNLQSLDLGSTAVKDISVLKGLTNLQSLDLGSTAIKDISVLKGLTNLQSLDLRSTAINDISGLKGLKKLQSLDLSYSSVENISVLKGLTNLQSLDLKRTDVNNISALEGLNKLQSLDLRITPIKDISPILHITRIGVPILWTNTDRSNQISLYMNPLTIPPLEIVKQGNEAILNYFEERESGEVQVHEAKLLIIGEAGTGKTTFARRVRDHEAPLPEEEKDTTRGIIIKPHTWSKKNLPDFQMNIWDFGGQDVYHGIHQIFLSKRALYVLILDGRREEYPHYWLQAQELLGQDSPLLVILNKKGEIHHNNPFSEWMQEHTNLKEYKEINLATETEQLKLLSSTVETYIRTLPHIQNGETLPSTWVAIKEKIDKLSTSYIRLEQFQEICEEVGIEEPKRQDFLSDYLHDLGHILHFRGEGTLNNIIFLDPQWAIDAIYKVLDHTKTQKRQGYFGREDLKSLWNNKSYRNVFEELLALMQLKGFELCFEVPKENRFIVPELLPTNRPEGYTWESEEGELQLRYKYDFMPKGIVPRLVVRLHAYLSGENQLWKRGAVFLREGATAEVVEHFREKHIHIRVKGQNRRRLLTIIAHQLDDINSGFHFSEKMNVHQLIPCSCRKCKSGNPWFFQKDLMDEALLEGVSEAQCNRSWKMIPIRSLLEETFYQDGTYKSYEGKQKYLPKAEQIKQFLLDGQLHAGLTLLLEIAKGKESESSVLQLVKKYNELERQVIDGTISSENKSVESNKIFQQAMKTLQILQKDHATYSTEEIPVRNPVPDPVTTERRGTTIINNNFYDQTSGVHVQQNIPQIEELIQLLQEVATFDEETAEEATDILEEIGEDATPSSPRQARKWKRWLGKVLNGGKKFVQGRMEKGTDTIISERLKEWLEGDGLEKLGTFIQNLG